MTEVDDEGRKQTGPTVSRRLFGDALDFDAAGYYPGLELINLLVCSSSDQTLPPPGPDFKLKRRAHDFARRLVWDEKFHLHPKRKEVLYDENSEQALRHLLRCLQLEIPNLTKEPGWERAHFFPYAPSLVHWDARNPRSRSAGTVLIERRYLRGGGTLAFRILRSDPDQSRLTRIRTGLDRLLKPIAQSALEKLASVLLAAGASDAEPIKDGNEPECFLFNDSSEDTYRDGVLRIVEHEDRSIAARIRAIMNWTAFWLVMVQHRRASAALKMPDSYIVIDCGSSNQQLRRLSQRCLKDLQQVIVNATEHAAGELALPTRSLNKIRGFFSSSAATIGLLNSWKGRRHFTLGIDILETLVLAGTEMSRELTFEKFVLDWLYGRCSLVTGRSAAGRAGLLASFDASIFEDNEESLAVQMKAAGLLTEYSDATRMVGTGGMQ
jgi:hypothetical protein